MLTARELLNIHFDQVFRGYNASQVDAFMARLVGEYESLMQENNALKAAALKVDTQVVADPAESIDQQMMIQQVTEAQIQLTQLEQEIKTAQLELRLIADEKTTLLAQLRALIQDFTALLAQSEPSSHNADPVVAASTPTVSK